MVLCFDTTTNSVKLSQFVSSRESLSCALQRQIRRIHRDWGPTSTRTESLRTTEWDSRPSRKGNSGEWISAIYGSLGQMSPTFFTSPLSAPDFRVTSASQTPCRSWWTRAKLPLSPPASLSSPGLLSWPPTPTCSVTKKLQLMWVRRGDSWCSFLATAAYVICNNEIMFARSQFEQILGLAQRSQDELFHIAMYNWLIQADLTDKLLEVMCPFMCFCSVFTWNLCLNVVVFMHIVYPSLLFLFAPILMKNTHIF